AGTVRHVGIAGAELVRPLLMGHGTPRCATIEPPERTLSTLRTTAGRLTAAIAFAALLSACDGAGAADHSDADVTDVSTDADVAAGPVGDWSSAPAMATPRITHTVTALGDGRVLAVGGYTTLCPADV